MRCRSQRHAMEAVSALENADQAALSPPIRDFQHDFGEFAEVLVVEAEQAEWIIAAGIETRGNQHELRPELFHGWKELAAEGAENLAAA